MRTLAIIPLLLCLVGCSKQEAHEPKAHLTPQAQAEVLQKRQVEKPSAATFSKERKNNKKKARAD